MAAIIYIFIEQTLLFIYVKYLKFCLSILTNIKFVISNTVIFNFKHKQFWFFPTNKVNCVKF